MTLNVEICGLRCHSQRLDVFLGFQVFLLVIGKFVLQLPHLRSHLMAQVFYRRLRIGNVEASRVDDPCKVCHGETVMLSRAVSPDAPDKEREDSLGILLQIVFEFEDAVVVERYCHTDVMQRRGIALQVFYGIGVGMKDVGVFDDSLRLRCSALQHVVVVGINTCYHVWSHLSADEVEEHRLLAPLQLAVRGQHHLEVSVFVLEACQHGAPEEDIVVTLHIRHDASPRLLGSQGVGRFEVVAIQVIF